MDIICGLLIASGLFLILWCVCGKFLFPIKSERLHVQYNACNDASEMEQCVRGFIWLRETGFFQGDLTIIDTGLDEDARYRALALEKKHMFIHIISDLPSEDDRIGEG